MAAEPASLPHRTIHLAVAAQVMLQSAPQSMSQLAVSEQETRLPAPRLNLQSVLPGHVATEFAPALSSHVEAEGHMISLPLPPMSVHSGVPPQTTIVGPVDEALHFEAASQVIEQLAGPQLALQSPLGMQWHSLSTQVHPTLGAARGPMSRSPLRAPRLHLDSAVQQEDGEQNGCREERCASSNRRWIPARS